MGVWYSSYRILISKGWGGHFCIMVYVCIIIFPIVDTWTVENLCGRFQLYQDTHPYDHIYHRRCGLSLISCRSRLYYFRRCWKDVEKILEIIFYFILWRQCCVCVGTHASCMKGFPKSLSYMEFFASHPSLEHGKFNKPSFWGPPVPCWRKRQKNNHYNFESSLAPSLLHASSSFV
jgi:hypothetical protein